MRLRSAGSLAMSLLLHSAVLGSGAWLLAHSLTSPLEPRTPLHQNVEIELIPAQPSLTGQGAGERARPQNVVPEPSAHATGYAVHLPRPDTQRASQGGIDRVNEPALNLSSSIDGLTLQRAIKNHVERRQVQRLRTSNQRRSWDDGRKTPDPMELSLVASGSGRRVQRRTPAVFDPARGIAQGAKPLQRGGQPGAEAAPATEGSTMPSSGTLVLGGERERIARGVADGSRRRDLRLSASVTLARPNVPRARPAVPTERRERPNDIIDARDEVASAVEALIAASTLGGKPDAGSGGQQGQAGLGSGGRDRSGSRSVSAGSGTGADDDARRDPLLNNYFRRLVRRVDPYWRNAFPGWAIAQGRGGLAIVTMTLRQDGSVADVQVVRPSGVAEFDRNVINAVERAAPFGPVPVIFKKSTLRVQLAFDALNAAVGREGPGPGGKSAANAPVTAP